MNEKEYRQLLDSLHCSKALDDRMTGLLEREEDCLTAEAAPLKRTYRPLLTGIAACLAVGILGGTGAMLYHRTQPESFRTLEAAMETAAISEGTAAVETAAALLTEEAVTAEGHLETFRHPHGVWTEESPATTAAAEMEETLMVCSGPLAPEDWEKSATETVQAVPETTVWEICTDYFEEYLATTEKDFVLSQQRPCQTTETCVK